MFKRIKCFFKGHDWKNDTQYPTHGWDDIPVKGSYCGNCGVIAK